MSAWIVYSKDGLSERCVLRSLEYGGTHMGERAVTATFDNSSEVAFEVFDYIEYRGEKFELEAVPTVKKTSDFNYEYELRFVSLKYELERCEMRDLVPNDNGVVYPTPLTFTFTGDVRYLVERIQACLDDLYGKGVWSIIVADDVKSEEKNISIAQQNCWNALALVSTTYGLNFYVKGRTITIGGEQSLVGHTFEYGKGNGLYEIERAADTGTGIVTKLRAYGASRNLDYSYPKKPEWSDSVLPVSFALSPLRLMLPTFKTDGKTDYVLADEATIAKYGIREASMVYDDIYPTITGATYNGQAIDEIKAVDEVDESKSVFTIELYDLGFDLEEHLTTSDAQISMKTGTLQGYTFNISGIEKLSDGYKLTLGRNSLENSEESGAYVPSKNWNMAKGDKFVLLNILMPQAYIREAENRLLARAKEYLAQYGKTNFSYNIGLHDKFLVEHPSVYDALVEGARLSVYDAELGISEDVTIQSITITENMEENILPQVKVTLNNEPSASTLDRIQGKLNEVVAETAANNFSSQSELMAQYRKKLDKPFFEKLFVAIDKNGNEIAANDVTTPVAYILAKYDFASVGGMTMYAEGGDLDIPSIYNGLPIDNETLYWEDVDGSRVLKAKGGEGGEGVADSVAWINVYGKPLWITDTKPTYSYSEIENTPDLSVYASKNEIPSLDGYATEDWVTGKNYVDGVSLAFELKKYVTINGDETINGLKNFAKGLQIDGLGITKSQDDVIYLDANLVVRGGITMYSDNTVDVGTIFDALPIDGNTIFWENGVLKANVTEGVITNITSAMVVEALGFTPYNASNPNGYISGITSGMVVSALGYTPLQNHQTIYALTIQKNGTSVGTYTPNSAKKTINIVVPTKVSELDNDEEYATTSDLDSRIDALINGAPTAFDTLKEIADVLQGNVNSIGDIITTLSTKADKAIKISAGTGLSGGGTLEADRTLSLATSGVTAGSYKSVTVDKYGRVTDGTNPTTLAGYGITDAYTKTKVDELLGNYVTLATKQTITGEKNFTGGLKVNGSPIVYDATNKYWKLEGDLLVTGGVTMYASDSAFTPSTIMDAIATDGVNLKVVDGVLTFVGQTGGGVADSVLWDNIEGKPSWIGSSKPSYSYSEISGTPTLLSSFHNDLEFVSKGTTLSHYGITNAIGYSDSIIADKADAYKLAGFGTTGGGFPVNGGAIKVGINNYQMILHGRHDTLRFNTVEAGTLKTWRKVWHDGNFTPSNYLLASEYTASDVLTKLLTVDGSGSGLDADLLDGYDSSKFIRCFTKEIDINTPINNNNAPFILRIGNANQNPNSPYLYSNLLHVSNTNSETAFELMGAYNYDKLLFRRGTWKADGSGTIFTNPWKEIAFTDSNVASATKLQTARTIWGQSFDGTTDVTGDLTVGDGDIILNNDRIIRAYPTSGGSINVLHFSSSNTFILGKGVASKGYNTYLDGYSVRLRSGTSASTGLMLNSAGNVLIGTTTNSGYKLDVVENTATKIFKVSSSANTFRISSTSVGAYNITNGGWSIYAGSASNESARFSVIDKDNTWIGVGWTLFRNGNMGICTTTDSGYRLDVNGNMRAKKNVKLLSGDGVYDGQMYISNGNLAFESSEIGVKLNDICLNPNGGKSQGHVTINGIPIYKSQDDVLYIDGNLAVRGGITMYATDAIDVPSIIDALPIASASAKGIAAFNPNDFSIVDGYVSFIGKGGVDESVLADYAKKTDLSKYLPLSGNSTINGLLNIRMTDTDYGLMYVGARDMGFVAGIDNYASGGGRGAGFFCENIDGSEVGRIGIQSDSTPYYRNPQGSYVLLHSGNWSDYVNVGSGNISGNKLTIDGEGYRGAYPALRLHIPNVTYVQFLLTESGAVELRYGDSGQSGGLQNLTLNDLYAEGTVYSSGFHGWNASPDYSSNYRWAIYQWGSEVQLVRTDSNDYFSSHAMVIDLNSLNTLFTGGITMYSDIRKKTKLQDVELTLQQIADAPLIEHYYNSDTNKTTHVGSIAQYWASMNDWFCKLDNDGYYTMEVQNAALASAISIARELVKYESKTDRKIRLLKQRVKELEDKIEKLENN